MSYNSKIIDASGNSRELRKIWGQQTGKILAPVSTKAIFFDGTSGLADQSDHIEIGDHDAFSFTDGVNDKPFSISVWAYVGNIATDDGPFVTKAFVSGVGETEYIFKHSNGLLRMFLYSGSGVGNRIKLYSNAPVLSSETWHNIVFTYNGNKASPVMKFYLDGATVAAAQTEDAPYGGQTNTSQPLRIGNTNNEPPQDGQAFEDQMADVVIFNKELTATEVLEVFGGTQGAAGTGRVKDMSNFSAAANIISWWKMGDGDNSSGTNGVRDSIGGYHGTLKNGAKIVNAKNLKSDYKLITV